MTRAATELEVRVKVNNWPGQVAGNPNPVNNNEPPLIDPVKVVLAKVGLMVRDNEFV